MTRRNMTTARRLRIFTAAGGVCHICGGKIDATREAWDADHVIPLEISRDDSDANLRNGDLYRGDDAPSPGLTVWVLVLAAVGAMVLIAGGR